MRYYHFLGIAGTAMASVAAALAARGESVGGSDAAVYPPMNEFLSERGIEYRDGYAAGNIDDAIQRAKELHADPLFVIGNAISRGNPEVENILNNKLAYTSLAALVGAELIHGRTSLVVSGTHGKTTTASLAAWVLETDGHSPGFLIGGITNNFGEGCRCAATDGVFVSEGDEYDTAFFDKRSKFVHYRPDLLIVNNIEFDHADIFSSIDDVVRSFRQVVTLVPSNGLILFNGDDERCHALASTSHTPVEFFGIGEQNDWRAVDVAHDGDGMRFVALHRTVSQLSSQEFRIPLSGAFNVRNALGVVAAARRLGVSMHEIQHAFETFRGVRRRMEIVAEQNGIIVIDDFAHHPTAVRETLTALRARYAERRLWALFEPRSNTTTRNIFQQELAEAFDAADEVVIGSVNRPERYSPAEILDVQRLLADIRKRGPRARAVADAEEMVALARTETRPGDVVVFLSNGSLGAAARKVLSNP
ncbi:MAG: UDP-N-acetylmuramate:L-alanyl-gamma-D-glutamyl-meso-diaminopimelate ligase [Ignavibacteriae bacterium]|nr:UDP-N-acetylmuramate:L-alanyl-gamma-D-glutamyl-meso-diaminopimelate ligase [Ignavibacteriota bacterium]